MDRRRKASNWERTSFRWDSSSSYYPPAKIASRSRQSNRHNSTGHSDDKSDYFFRQANRARQLSAIDSVVSRHNISNSTDGVECSSSSTGTQRREQRRLVRNGFISPLNIERNRSSANAEVNLVPESPAVQRGGANSQHRPPTSAEGKLVPNGCITERIISSTTGSSVNAALHVDPDSPAVQRSSGACSIPIQVPPEPQAENRKRKRWSSNPVSSSSSRPSTRILRSQSTHRNRHVQSDEMLARQLQQELYNEMQGIVNVIAASNSTSTSRQNQAPRRTDGRQNQAPRRTDGGGAAAARLQIQHIQRDFNGDDYEMLLALDENNHLHSGASESQIKSLPQSIIQNADDSQEEDPCAVCRDIPAVGDVIRHLPCFHKFHKDCIDLWLERKPLCPVCKSDVR